MKVYLKKKKKTKHDVPTLVVEYLCGGIVMSIPAILHTKGSQNILIFRPYNNTAAQVLFLFINIWTFINLTRSQHTRRFQTTVSIAHISYLIPIPYMTTISYSGLHIIIPFTFCFYAYTNLKGCTSFPNELS